MSGYIGSVADVASGEIEVGYASPYALVSASEINGKANILPHPVNLYQLKIESAPYGKVRVFVVDRSSAVEWTVCAAVDTAIPRNREERVVRLVQQLQQGSILSVS